MFEPSVFYETLETPVFYEGVNICFGFLNLFAGLGEAGSKLGCLLPACIGLH